MRRRPAHTRGLALLALAVCLTFAGQAHAQSQEPLKVPHLNGHRFIPSENLADPFLNTYFVNQLGGGIASDLQFPLFEIDGDTLFAPRGDLVFAVLNFEYRQRIKRWLAVHGSFRTIARLGTDVQALLSAGVTASTEFEFGWLVKLHESDKSALSLDLGFNRANTTVVDLFRFLEDVVDRNDPRLVDNIPSVQAFASARYAHGFSSLVGLRLEGTAYYGEQTQGRDSGSEFTWRLGAGVSLDGRESIGVPIGAVVSYAVTTLSLGRIDTVDDTREFEVKLTYTAPTDFSIGPSVGVTSVPGLYQSRITFLTAVVSSRYYF